MVAEQIVYEIGDPQSYALPDVICDFSHVRVESAGEQRVRVSGARGRAPSGRYKVCTTHQDGWRMISIAPVVGRDAARKAVRQSEAVLERVEELLRAKNMPPFRAKRIEPIGAETTYGAQARAQSTREVACKIGVEHDDPEALKLLLREIESPATSMSVGTTGWFGARPAIAPVMRVFSTMIARDSVPARIEMEERRNRRACASERCARAGPCPAANRRNRDDRSDLAARAADRACVGALGRQGRCVQHRRAGAAAGIFALHPRGAERSRGDGISSRTSSRARRRLR